MNPSLEYEPEVLEYVVPAKRHKYTYDFLTENGTPVECKGYFRPGDKAKLIAVRNEGWDIHILLMYPREDMIRWCKRNGFPYAVGKEIPDEW